MTRLSSSLVLASLACIGVVATPIKFDGRATFPNVANAVSIAAHATPLANGVYTFQNNASGDWMLYESGNGLGQSFFPAAASSGSPMNLEMNFDGTFPNAIRISPAASNEKCVSAQWGADYEDGVDWAGVLYACAVGSGELVSGLVRAKQYWYFVSTSGQPQGPSPYYIIPADHIDDQVTRAFTDCHQSTGGPPANAYSVCLEPLSTGRLDQAWNVQPDGSITASPAVVPAAAAPVAAPAPAPVAAPAPAPAADEPHVITIVVPVTTVARPVVVVTVAVPASPMATPTTVAAAAAAAATTRAIKQTTTSTDS